MARRRRIPGEDLSRRLAERRELGRVSVPGGGEAWSGPTATRALEALGARAMTVDRSVIVSEDFDPSRPEDAALYAHEQLHLRRGSTAGGAHPVHEAEETAARSMEQMVFHRMAGSAPSGSGGAASSGQGGRPEAGSGASRGLQAMLAQGMSRADIVDKLAREVVDALDRERNDGLQRQADTRSFR